MKKILTGIAIAAAVLAAFLLLGFLQERIDPDYEERITALEERDRDLEDAIKNERDERTQDANNTEEEIYDSIESLQEEIAALEEEVRSLRTKLEEEQEEVWSSIYYIYDNAEGLKETESNAEPPELDITVPDLDALEKYLYH